MTISLNKNNVSSSDMSSLKQKSSFLIEGVFLQFVASDSLRDGKAVRATSPLGKHPKALWVATTEGEYQIKLAKPLRINLKANPQPGDWVKMAGHRTVNLLTGEVKLKAYTLQPLSCGVDMFSASPQVEAKAAKTKVLVCQKSDCRAKGSQAVQQAIADTLQECGLADQVTVKGTGCMGCCKKGANVVFMPDKARYQQVKPTQVPALVEKHIVAKMTPAPSPAEADAINRVAEPAEFPKVLAVVQG
jgi:(2Fe-2S) ferredoxin